MIIKGLHHNAYRCRDSEETRKFYEDFLGLPLVNAFEINETSEQTPWRPYLWPYKMVVPLACLLLLIQGVSETIKSLWAARTGIELEHKEKVEV